MKVFSTLTIVLITGGSILFGDPIFIVQSGGVVITGQNTGTAGTQLAPWIINETMTAVGSVALIDAEDDAPLGTLAPFASGSWIAKTVLNNTGVTWVSFEMELQEVFGTPSPDGDGLSFAQGGGLTFFSDKFSVITRADTTRDYLNFSGGSVLDGESVVFTFAVTDNSPQSPIYLFQTPNKADGVESANAVPEPASMLPLLGLALVVSLISRKNRIVEG